MHWSLLHRVFWDSLWIDLLSTAWQHVFTCAPSWSLLPPQIPPSLAKQHHKPLCSQIRWIFPPNLAHIYLSFPSSFPKLCRTLCQASPLPHIPVSSVPAAAASAAYAALLPVFTLFQLPGITFLSECNKQSPAPLQSIWTSTCSPDSNHMPLDLFWSVGGCFVRFGQDPAPTEIKEKIPIDSMALVPNFTGCFPRVWITAAHWAHLAFRIASNDYHLIALI